jgi:hypothetical protein
MATEILIQETITEVSVTDPNNILVEVDGTQGPVGASNSLAIGATTVLTPDQNPTSTITGTSPSQTLSLGLPRAAAVTVSGTTVVNPNVSPSVATVDTSGDKAVTFSLPRAPTTTIGTTTTGNAGTSAAVSNTGTLGDALLNFTIPRGDKGETGDLTKAQADSYYVDVTGDTMTGFLSLHTDPTASLHAATKQYVDNLAAGVNFHAAVRLATTANLTSTYSNGTSGVGATLTATVNDTLTIDGFVAALDDRVLVKSQTTALQNGIYKVTAAGSGAAPWVLTRATDADDSPDGEVSTGDFCFTETGTANGGSGFILITTGAITIGTTALTYTQFNTAQAIVAGTGLTESPVNTLSVTVPVVSPTGQSGKFLSTDGTYTSWAVAPVTLAGSETLTNKTLTSPVINTATFKDGIIKGTEEDINIVASAATGTINLDVDTASVWYYTTSATANHTLNIRYSSSVSLNTALATGDAITVVWLNTNGATAYYPNVIQVDGTTVTPKWQGGTAPTAGNASSIDSYSFTIIKTASATFTVLASQTQFK